LVPRCSFRCREFGEDRIRRIFAAAYAIWNSDAATAIANAGICAAARSISATRVRCPTSYWGIESGHRRTSANPGAALTPSSARNSSRTAATISSSLRLIISRLISPPTNARARIAPAGARPSNLKLEKLPAIIRRCSIAGTTKPKARGGPSKALSLNVRLTVAADA
jgi:hypothetical protein